VIFTTGFAAQFVALTAIRPPSRIDDIAIVLMVLGFYALSPTPLLKRAMPAIGLTTGFVLVLWLVRGDISEEELRKRPETLRRLADPSLRGTAFVVPPRRIREHPDVSPRVSAVKGEDSVPSAS
jgi:hypothetical protein